MRQPDGGRRDPGRGARRPAFQRISERSLRSMKSSIRRTSGAPSAAAASWARASASGRPLL